MDQHEDGERVGPRKQSSAPVKRAVGVGVTSIKRKSKHVYQIAFTYRDVECRELISLDDSKRNDQYCLRLRSEILGKIERQQFVYKELFPLSKRLAIFGESKDKAPRKIGPDLDAYKTLVQRTKAHSTFTGYRKSIDNVLKPWVGDMTYTEFTPAVIRKWVKEQTTSLKRITNNLLPLRAVIDDAIADEIIENNPFDKVKISKLVAPEQKDTEYEPDPYTEDELVTLFSNLDGLERWVFQAWAYTGVRTGEQVGLRWPRVDLNAKQISIVETTTERKDKPRPKTESGRRSLQLLPAALEAFEKMRPLTELTGGRVFINPLSTRPDKAWDDKKLAGRWKKAHKGTGIRYRKPYQLRHTFASNLLTQGENPSLIAKMLGHKNAEMVIRVYAKYIERGAALGFDRPPRTYGMKRLWDVASNDSGTGVTRAA